MVRLRAVSAALIASIGLLCVGAPAASAQTAGGEASSTTSTLTPKEAKAQHKAQRKAQRKTARAKKNAELKALEQNGYQPSGRQDNYPDNLKNAEQKAAAPKAAHPAPASGQ
jgi:hypothetical protein